MVSRWAESALSWWEEAGVDTIVGEAPRDWLNPRPKAEAAAPAPVQAEAMPDSLDAFLGWLASTDALPFASPSIPRIAPAGDPAASLMVVTDMPTDADVAAGTIFSGEAGVLVEKMLAAIGRSRETIWLAPFSPIRPPAGRIDPAGVRTLTQIALHHIGLVGPRALLIFGDSCSRALLGQPMTAARGRWHDLETPKGPVRALVTIRPQELLTQPRLKAHAWADLQMLMEGLTP
ncbi:MAG TPA: uracil-DNA glycosylase family protein [Allosphingosinicella sp.]|nr:uracil-DNA glycosylase family protein [Allosphingosinicella sp.]